MTDQHLLTIPEALAQTQEEVRERYKNYMNPGLVNMMGMLDFDKRFVKADGVQVWDDTGDVYLDFLGAYGALNLGHNHPRVIKAVESVKEAPNLLQASLGALTAAFAHNLAMVAPGALSRTFFCNSGAEAVEGALKLVRIATRKRKIIYTQNSFHGKSFGALSVTGREKYQASFQPLLSGFEFVPFGNVSELEKVLRKKDTAALILEPIQGEGGIVVPPEGYLRAVRELCDRYRVLLILDEVQTGMGRTGCLFACEREEVVPDVMCLAKSLGGGIVPLGAFMTTPEIWDRAYGSWEKATLHTSTFGGNTRACAAGIATLEVLLEEDLPAQAGEKGRYFLERLKELKEKYSLIVDVRGRGLMIGVEFSKPVSGWANKLSAGLVNRMAGEFVGSLVAGELLNNYHIITAYTLNNPNVVRLEPPLTVTREELDQVVDALEEICQKYRNVLGLAMESGKKIWRSRKKG